MATFVKFFFLKKQQKYLLVFHFSLFIICGYSQSQSNIRYKSFAVSKDTLSLDSLSVVPNTIVVRANGNEIVDGADYTIKAFESKLIWRKKPSADSVKIFFRVFPFSLAGETYNKSYVDYKHSSANSVARPFTYTPDDVKSKLVDFGTLNYNGSFSRSISFGNSQDLVLNSVFNLQMSGMLTKDLEITAAISDNNIPIQPEGNTQQLQEFDKVFIQLKTGQHKLIVGDFDLSAPASGHFLKFSRKYQGVLYSGSYKINKSILFKTTVGGGVARGKFSRNILAITDGNQGPYALTGANGETVITILANSEAVYINDVKMDRGTDRDYTIDYNLGQITFMPKRVITQDLRIVVEFQYSNNNYSRTAVFAGAELLTKKVDLHCAFYSEQDAKNQSIAQSLDSGQVAFLSHLGDSTQKAYYKGYDTVAWNANQILYAMVDTVLNGMLDTIFVYSIDSTKAKYAVNFSLVAAGIGDYTPSTAVANGRVFQWVPPYVDSVGKIHHQGTYVPQIYLVAPSYQQMLTLGADWHINKNNTLSVEGAMSNYDPNMFSTIDNNTHIGFAGHVNYTGQAYTKGDSSSKDGQKLVYNVDYEFLQNRFNAIERFRDVEFNRDWNLDPTQTQQYTQSLASGSIGYVWKNLGSITYNFKLYVEDSVYKGYENTISGSLAKNGFRFTFLTSYLISSSTANRTDFIRPKADLSYTIKKLKSWKVGTGLDNEINLIKDRGYDTLSTASYVWQNYKVYMASPDSSKNKYSIEYNMRFQQRPNIAGTGFDQPYYSSEGINFAGSINTFKNQTLNFNLTYRHAVNTDSISISDVPTDFYLGRIDYNITAAKGLLRSTTLYEIGTGREQKTQVTYQLSPTNQGNYIWVDLNHDGIQEINEFILSPYATDSSYVRVLIPTPEYDPVNTNQFNEVLNITPSVIWKYKKDYRRIISLFSAIASVQISKKTYAEKGKTFLEYINPIPLASEDTNLVATTVNSRNSLYFNRLNPKYGAQFDFIYARGRSLLTGGSDDHTTQSEALTARWTPFKSFNMQVIYTNGLKSDESDFYANLRYRFTYNDISTDFGYQFGTKLRMDLKYEFALKLNPTGMDSVGTQTAEINKLTLEGRYNAVKKNTINFSLSYAAINYNDKGYENDQLEYAMLDGLLNNSNLVWSAGYSQNLSTNIQMTLTYDGRMTGFTTNNKSTLSPINTFKAEVRALF